MRSVIQGFTLCEKKLLMQLIVIFVVLFIGQWMWFMYKLNEATRESDREYQEVVRHVLNCQLTIQSGFDSPHCHELDRLYAKQMTEALNKHQ